MPKKNTPAPVFDMSGSELGGGTAEQLLSLVYGAQANILSFWDLASGPKDLDDQNAYLAHLRATLEKFEEMRSMLAQLVFDSKCLE